MYERVCIRSVQEVNLLVCMKEVTLLVCLGRSLPYSVWSHSLIIYGEVTLLDCMGMLF